MSRCRDGRVSGPDGELTMCPLTKSEKVTIVARGDMESTDALRRLGAAILSHLT